MVQTPKWRSDQVLTETNLVAYHKRKKLCRDAKALTSSMWEKKQKEKSNSHVLFPKTSVVTLLCTQWKAERHICMKLFKGQPSNPGWHWLGTATGCGFGEGKRIDHAGAWSESKKSRNSIICSGCCTRQFAEHSDEHPSRSSSQLVQLPHRRIELFCHTLLLKASPPSSAAPPALPAPWEHRPPLPQWGKTTKRTKVFFPGLTQVTSLTKQLLWKVICPGLRQIRIRALSTWQPCLHWVQW